jgi:NADH-quinone oxidoreductase subunit L
MLAATEASSGWFLENAYLIPLVPAIGFVLILLFGKTLGRLTNNGAYIGVATIGASLVLAAGTAYQWIQRVDSVSGEEGAFGMIGRSVGLLRAAEEGGSVVTPVVNSWTWWSSGGFEFTIGTHVDGLSMCIALVVAFISFLVQIYSLEYLRGDRRFTHYYASLTLFSAGMLGMVLADNMLMFLLGWEIMGLCSFLLIGHWWEEDANSRAALKAFFTVRVGDVGLLIGISILFFSVNAWAQENLGLTGFSIEAINAWALSGTGSATVLTAASVALFIACIGKSGQFPLHTWLPDAMAGPTPVSSLLHSSTMVVAGVYLVARLFPVFHEGFTIPDTNVNLIAVIGGITIVIAAVLAFVQTDIKKVLAYSTVSQLGYMMMGLGVGAWLPAVFHIFTHAFFKACLFLAAGSVSHSGSHHSFDMKKDMGGLAKKMPITATTWIVSTAALMGIFPLSGFFSKDEIIDNAGHNGYTTFMVVGLVGAFLTAAYMTRATYLTFFGTPRGAAAGEHAHIDHAVGGEQGSDEELEEERELAMVGAPALEADAHAPPVDDHGAHGGGHGGHDDHGAHRGPHESNALITVPLMILATLALVAGFVNAVPFGEKWERFKTYVEPVPAAVEIETFAAAGGPGEAVGVRAQEEPAAEGEEGGHSEELTEGCGYTDPEEGTVCFFPAISHAEFKWSKALVSLAIVAAGIGISLAVCIALYERRSRALVGLTDRNKILKGGYLFLWNKYYLDDLYEKVIVHGVAHPLARAMYWINQRVIDRTVDEVGRATVEAGRLTYKYVDQSLVDGVVNGAGKGAEETGHALQPLQNGKVSSYGALLFGAAALGALILVLAV